MDCLESISQRYKVIRIHGGILHIEIAVGYFNICLQEALAFFLLKDNERIDTEDIHLEQMLNDHLDKAYQSYVLTFNVPLYGTRFELKLSVEINGERVPISESAFDQYAELSGCFRSEYYTNGGWVIYQSEDNKGLIIEKSTRVSNMKREVSFLAEVFMKRELVGSKKSVVLRALADVIRPFIRKSIWLVSDRISHADDNGEVFYRYLKKNHNKDVRAFFLLHPASEDYCRLKKELGGIVAPYSWTHKLLALLAEWSISSQTDHLYRDPFRDYGQPYRSILRKTRFVCLQHGVMSNDLSRWLNKDEQELDGIIASTCREYDSLLNGNYHYTKEQVWMTGLSRFDRLANESEKTITVMPTWRLYLFIEQDHDTGEWKLMSGFKNTRYAEFYRSLMNNRKLRQVAEEHSYKLQFKAHPTFTIHMDEFGFDGKVNVVPPEISYTEIYKKSSLVVTDYSSSIYDFIYLRKPVIYCQFDAEEFFSGNHIWDKGDFDYEKEGFGEVLYNLEDTVDTMVKYIETDCVLREPYKSRIEEIFPDRNPNHCEQIYKRIKSKGQY